ncbi:hypothetical protein ACS0TY_021909 [Phlomoides rotata]
MEGAIIVNGLWGKDRVECYLINIYASCILVEKAKLLDIIHQVIQQNPNACICATWDFNLTRREAKIVGRRAESSKQDTEIFDEFIQNSELIDLPLHGRSFTWFKLDGEEKEILKLDMVDEALGLEEHEVVVRNKKRVLLFNEIKCKDSLLCKKSIARWIKEGNVHTSYFHKCINKWRKNNEIVGVKI